MRQLIAAVALASGFAIAAHAQDTTVTTTQKTSGGEAKTVTYTGCVQNGVEAQHFVLNKVVPVSRTTTTDTVGTSGTTTVTTATTYALVPEQRVEIRPLLGQKVEVTGMLIPAGETKTETRTKIERDDAPDTKTVERSKTNSDMPQFHVISIKKLAETCE